MVRMCILCMVWYKGRVDIVKYVSFCFSLCPGAQHGVELAVNRQLPPKSNSNSKRCI